MSVQVLKQYVVTIAVLTDWWSYEYYEQAVIVEVVIA